MANNNIWIGTYVGNEGDFATAANWSLGTVPATTDDVYFEDSSQSVITGLDNSAMAGSFGSVNIAQSFTGSIGTSTDALQVKTAVVNLGYHNGPGSPTGSPLVNIDTGSVVDCAYTVSNTGTSADSSKSPVRIKAAGTVSNSNTLIVYKGKVSVGIETADITTKFSILTVSYDARQTSDSDVFIGSGVTLGDLNILGGDVVLECAATNVTIEAGTLLTTGIGAITNLFVNGGVVTSNSTGTIALLDIYGGTGIVDFTKSNALRTVSATQLDPGGVVKGNVANLTSFEVVPHTADRNITYTAS
jgi:hypothetical protein